MTSHKPANKGTGPLKKILSFHTYIFAFVWYIQTCYPALLSLKISHNHQNGIWSSPRDVLCAVSEILTQY